MTVASNNPASVDSSSPTIRASAASVLARALRFAGAHRTSTMAVVCAPAVRTGCTLTQASPSPVSRFHRAAHAVALMPTTAPTSTHGSRGAICRT